MVKRMGAAKGEERGAAARTKDRRGGKLAWGKTAKLSGHGTLLYILKGEE